VFRFHNMTGNFNFDLCAAEDVLCAAPATYDDVAAALGETGASGQDIDLVSSVLLGAVLSTLFTLPMATPFVATGRDIAWLALLGLVQLAIPCALSVVCARSLKAPEVALLALLEVIFGIAWAWLGAGEDPGSAVLLGGSLVIGALVANEWIGLKQRQLQ
jgi:drug/metabolite transporter (DMT)-like permease